ncbi:hypothetical protein D3C77_677810 [compost metagenome]
MRLVRQHEAHRLDDMRRLGQQHFAFCQRFAHQAELVVLQIAQATVDQLAAGRGGMAGQVVLLAEQYRQAASGRIGGDTDAVDAATDHGNVIDFGKGGRWRAGLGHEAASGFYRI